MGAVYRHVCLLLIMSVLVLGEEVAYTSATDGGETFHGRLKKVQVQTDTFTRIRCRWDQDDRSATCQGMYLKTVPTDFPENTKALNIARNVISVLLNASFEPYPNLVTLDVSYNLLTTIQPAAFQPLKHLESLNLLANWNLVIPNSVPFRSLNALVELNLEYCSMTELPNDLIEWFPKLRYLYLTGNDLSYWNVSRCKTDILEEVMITVNKFQDITPENFAFACPTVVFTLWGGPIRSISEDVIASLPVQRLELGEFVSPSEFIVLNVSNGVARSSINDIYFGFIELSGSPVALFSPLYNHPLVRLHITHSGYLPLNQNANFFLGLNCLEELELIGDYIEKLKPEYFKGMSGLRALRLIKNGIMQVNPHIVNWESNIEHLSLSENQIIELYDYELIGLDELTSLNLSRNEQLCVLDLISYGGLDSLQTIDLTETGIVQLAALSPGLKELYFCDRIPGGSAEEDPFLPGITFNDTKVLEIIYLSHSDLNRRSVWNSNYNFSLFQGLQTLHTLHLGNNPLSELPEFEGVFQDNVLLAYLTMDNCKLSFLNGNLFHGLKSLVYLDLNGNNFLLISHDALKNLPVLEALSINDNKLMFVEEEALDNVPRLRFLSLSNNRLVAFNRSTWSTLMKYDLISIDVSGNPLACQCRYGWLHDLANSSGLFLYHNETLCSADSLSALRGKDLFQFDPSIYCVPNIILISTLPLVVLALLIGLLLAFHNRWLIRYKLFLVRLAIIGYREMQDTREHDEFFFDFNIMFTAEDEPWAREFLRPILEQRLPDYDRYSFGDEDLTLGMHYLEAVHYAVEHSFKTILLLSRRAVRDNWFLIKFRTAMDHVHDELTENTVVIFLEDIPEDEIPYLVRLYLSDRRPYMKWPEDVRGHGYFWNELTKVVTINLKYNPRIPPE